jgi:hypothetical protein
VVKELVHDSPNSLEIGTSDSESSPVQSANMDGGTFSAINTTFKFVEFCYKLAEVSDENAVFVGHILLSAVSPLTSHSAVS